MPANKTVSTPEYNEKHGPSLGNTVSLRGFRMPADMKRSRRVGLARDVCSECGAVKGERLVHHESKCSVPGTRIRQRTGPLSQTGTSADALWTPRLPAVQERVVLAA